MPYWIEIDLGCKTQVRLLSKCTTIHIYHDYYRVSTSCFEGSTYSYLR